MGASRGVFRWMVALSVYDFVPAALLGALAVVSLSQGALLFTFPALAMGGFLGYLGVLKVAAGRRIRSGIVRKDGALFASGFASLRTLLIVLFIGNFGGLVFALSCNVP
ncbi:MAG: hypothetical protein AAGA54_34905 [Myxococcota bacterium]